MNFTAVALGSNKHDLSPHICFEETVKFAEKILECYKKTLVATGLSQDFRNPDQMSAEQEELKWILEPQ